MIDVLIDYDNKTMFKDGDLNVGTCDEQNKRLLLVSEKGSFKEFPASCVGLTTFLENEDISGLLREVRAQFGADGMTVKSVDYSDGKLTVDASY